MTNDDAFMILAGVRYCLGRHSYAPSLCCGWLKTKWPTLSEGDRGVIMRDIEQHIADEEQSQTQTWAADLQTWRSFYVWAQDDLTHLQEAKNAAHADPVPASTRTTGDEP